MQISRDFTIAVHTLLCIGYFSTDNKVTSDFISKSVGVNPVIIRNMMLMLKKAGLIEVKQGAGGATLAKTPKQITLLDIYKATGCNEKPVFNFHENPNKKCPVGKNIHTVLDSRLDEIQELIEKKLKTTTIAELLAGLPAKK